MSVGQGSGLVSVLQYGLARAKVTSRLYQGKSHLWAVSGGCGWASEHRLPTPNGMEHSRSLPHSKIPGPPPPQRATEGRMRENTKMENIAILLPHLKSDIPSPLLDSFHWKRVSQSSPPSKGESRTGCGSLEVILDASYHIRYMPTQGNTEKSSNDDNGQCHFLRT